MEKVYGPYTRKDGRKHVIVYPNGNAKRPLVRYTVSYPKYLMEKHLGRRLEKWETVDHINRDFTDDRIENLQILERSNHATLDNRRVKRIEIICIWCKSKAVKYGGDLRGNAKQGKAGPFCGKVCSGQYGNAFQHGKVDKLEREDINTESEYYYLEK